MRVLQVRQFTSSQACDSVFASVVAEVVDVDEFAISRNVATEHSDLDHLSHSCK